LIRAAGGEGAVHIVDHENPDAVGELVAAVKREQGPLDVVVNFIFGSEATGLAGEPSDDLDPAASFAEGALDMKLECRIRWWCTGGEPQVGGQPFAVGGQAFHRRWVGGGVPGGHLADPGVDDLHEPGPWRGLEIVAAGLCHQVLGGSFL